MLKIRRSASRTRWRARMRATKKPCTTMRTTCARWNTACRPPRGLGWESIDWSCSIPTRPRSATCCCFRTCAQSFERGVERSIPPHWRIRFRRRRLDRAQGSATRDAMGRLHLSRRHRTAALWHEERAERGSIFSTMRSGIGRPRYSLLGGGLQHGFGYLARGIARQYPALPVIGVIEPGAAAAVAASASQHIAVIATEGTINGGAYESAIQRANPGARITSRACSLFVAMAEEGWTSGPIAQAVARRYLEPIFLREGAPDTLVLGCTHFPVLVEAITAVLPRSIRVVDSALTTAAAVAAHLHGGAAADVHGGPAGTVSWLATDGAARFARVGSAFLGQALSADDVQLIDL